MIPAEEKITLDDKIRITNVLPVKFYDWNWGYDGQKRYEISSQLHQVGNQIMQLKGQTITPRDIDNILSQIGETFDINTLSQPGAIGFLQDCLSSKKFKSAEFTDPDELFRQGGLLYFMQGKGRTGGVDTHNVLYYGTTKLMQLGETGISCGSNHFGRIDFEKII